MNAPRLVLPAKEYGPNRKNWLAARRNGIGASEAAAILGLDNYATPLSVYVDKATPDLDDDAGEAAYWGNRLEDVVAREWGKRNRRQYGVIVPSPGILAHPRHEWMFATIDRGVATRRGAEPYAVLECKTTDGRNDGDWAEDAPPPNRVVVQVLHQLAVTGQEVGYVAALVGGNRYRQWVIERDDELINDVIIPREAEFWQMVLDRQPPAPIGLDADNDALAELYRGDPGREVDLDSDVLSDLRRSVEIRGQIKKLTAEQKQLDQNVKAAMGDRTEAFAGDGKTLVATWRPVSSTSISATKVREKFPEIVDEVSTTKTFRSFLTKKGATNGA